MPPTRPRPSLAEVRGSTRSTLSRSANGRNNSSTASHVEGVSGPPGAAWGPQARGGGSAAGTVEDSVGQQATLTPCQPGSDTPGPPVGLWAGDRPPSTQVRTIIPPQVHRPGQSGNPPLRQAGSRLLVNPGIINVERGRRRCRTIGIHIRRRIGASTGTDIEVQQ